MKPLISCILQWLNLFLLLGLFLSGPISAQMVDTPPAPDNPALTSDRASPTYVAQARKAIDAVFAEPEFDRTRIVKVPRLKEDGEKNLFDTFIKWLKKHLRNSLQDDSESYDGSHFFARAGQIVLWLLAFGLIVLLVAYSKRWLPFLGWWRSRVASASPVKQSDSILEIAVALPEDIATTAEHRWKEGKKAEALSLLYRGTIALLAARHRIDLPQGATEEEIRLLIVSAMPSFKDDFSDIARAWLCLAYAHRPPAEIVGLLAVFNRLQQTGGAAS
jgi:hypothetical protein